MDPSQQLIQEPLQTQLRLTCNVTQNDVIAIEWQVQFRGAGASTTSTSSLRLNNIILSEQSTISRSIEITGTQRNSGSVYTCVVTVPGQTGDGVLCVSEPITVVFYGLRVC